MSAGTTDISTDKWTHILRMVAIQKRRCPAIFFVFILFFCSLPISVEKQGEFTEVGDLRIPRMVAI